MHSGAGSWALRQDHLQVQALALAYNGELDGLTWPGPEDEGLEVL